jgi:solute carrier family 25 (mitochondrial folate transporter), member 32
MTDASARNIKFKKDVIELFSGLVAGSVSVTLCAPLDISRTRLNILVRTIYLKVNVKLTRTINFFWFFKKLSIEKSKRKYTGFFNTLGTIFKEEGIKGLYKGYTISLLGLPIFQSIYFFTYQRAKITLRTNYLPPKYQKNEDIVNMLSATWAGLVSIILTNPFWVSKNFC